MTRPDMIPLKLYQGEDWRILEVEFNELLPERVWRWAVKRLAEYTCERCGKVGKAGKSDAHHKDGDRSNNRLSNGECLCRQCHTQHHKDARALLRPAIEYKFSEEHRSNLSAAIKESWKHREPMLRTSDGKFFKKVREHA